MKRKIRLTEGDLRRVIGESVRQALNEIEWQTAMNAAKKRGEMAQAAYDRGDKALASKYWNKQLSNTNAARDRFNDKHNPDGWCYGANDTIEMVDPYGTYEHGDIYTKCNSKNGTCNTVNGSNEFTHDTSMMYNQDDMNRRGHPMANRFQRANQEVADYQSGRAQYVPGRGYVTQR